MQRGPPIRIFLLGRFEVARGERIIQASRWSRRKAAALLQRLALERRLVKDQAIDFLWPEASLDSGANNLYRTLHALRQTLDAALGPGAAHEIITFDSGILSLGTAVWVDAVEFERLCSQSLQALTAEYASQLEQALNLYQGDLLPDDLYAEWTILPRESLRRTFREASLELAAYRRNAHNYAGALALLNPLLAADPADEEVHRQLMQTFALAGRRHDALRQYQACVDALAAELDVPPSLETTQLYQRIQSGELGAQHTGLTTPALTPLAPTAQPGVPLIGRDEQMKALRRWLMAIGRGRGGTFLIAGEAGVGKTRLAGEALAAAASQGMAVLQGAAYEQEGRLAYQPFIEAFDRYLADLARSSEENPITHFKRQRSGDPQQDHWALFKAAASFLVNIAASRPLVLLVDDLHAADETSLRLFHYLARQARTAPIALLATYRTDAVASAATPLDMLLNALYRERISETIQLDPLPQDAVALLLAHILGGDVDPELTAAVYEITEGNTFFVQEIITALQKAGQIEEHAGCWRRRPGQRLQVPEGLSGLLHERVSRLGREVETMLTTAAVIGPEFSFDVLRGVAALSDRVLLDAVDAALTAQLLEETSAGYRFRHALIRRTLYDSLSSARRAWLHGRTAETIEALCAGRPARLDAQIEALAFHYDQSDQPERALSHLIKAGRKAARMYAFEVAIGYYERALALLESLGGEENPRQCFWLLESLGKYYKLLADTPKAVAALERALTVRSEHWQPAPADRARIRRLAAMGLLTAGRLEEAASHLQQALDELGENQRDTLEFANVLYNIAQLHWHRNEYQESFKVAERSLIVAERLNETAAIARAFEMLALACHSLGEWQAGLGYEEQRSTLAGPGLDVTDAFDVHL